MVAIHLNMIVKSRFNLQTTLQWTKTKHMNGTTYNTGFDLIRKKKHQCYVGRGLIHCDCDHSLKKNYLTEKEMKTSAKMSSLRESNSRPLARESYH